MEYIVKEKNGEKITTKMLQKKLYEALKEIDKICEENKIDYFLADGTCLGAVRHQGFIPWDDDVDIAMSRKDYNKFIKALEKNLSDKYTYHCYEKGKKYLVTWPAMKIRIKNTYIKEKNFLLNNKCKDSDGIFIDVFIYDYMAKHRIFDIPLRTINTILMPIIILFENVHINPIPLKELFRLNARLYGKLCKKSEYFSDEITWVFNPIHPYKTKYKDIYPTKKIKFEDTYLRVPGNYHNYLKTKYGNNYMTPVEEKERVCKHIKDINLNNEQQDNNFKYIFNERKN